MLAALLMRPPLSLVYTTPPSPDFLESTVPTFPSHLEVVLQRFLTEMSIMPFNSSALARLIQQWRLVLPQSGHIKVPIHPPINFASITRPFPQHAPPNHH